MDKLTTFDAALPTHSFRDAVAHVYEAMDALTETLHGYKDWANCINTPDDVKAVNEFSCTLHNTAAYMQIVADRATGLLSQKKTELSR